MHAPEENFLNREQDLPDELAAEPFADLRDPRKIREGLALIKTPEISDTCLTKFPVFEGVSTVGHSPVDSRNCSGGGILGAVEHIWMSVFKDTKDERGNPTEVTRTKIKKGREVKTSISPEAMEHDDGCGTRIRKHNDGSIHASSEEGFEFHRAGSKTLLKGPDGREITREITSKGVQWSTRVDGAKIDVSAQVREALIEYQRARVKVHCGCAPRAHEQHDHPGGEQPFVTVHDDAVSAADRKGNVVTHDQDGNTLVRTPARIMFLITKDNKIFGFDSQGDKRQLTEEEIALIRLTEDGKIEINGVTVLNGKATTTNGPELTTELTSDRNGARARVTNGDGQDADVHVKSGRTGEKEVRADGGAHLAVTPDGRLTIHNRDEDKEYECDFNQQTMRGFYPGREKPWFSYDEDGNFRLWNDYLIKWNGEMEDEDGHSLIGDQYEQTADYANAVGNAQAIASSVGGKNTREITRSDLDKLGEAENDLFQAIQVCIARDDLMGLYHLYCAQFAVQNAKNRVQHVLYARHEANVAGLPDYDRQRAEELSVTAYYNPEQAVVQARQEQELRQRQGLV